jgi:hypothetical protein
MPVEIPDGDTMIIPGSSWRAVADELASALQETMLRNPSLTARDWSRAHAALQRYERSAGVKVSVPAEPPAVPEG